MGEEKQKLKGRCQLQTQSQTLKAVISISNIEQCSSGLYKQCFSHFWFYSERLEIGLARVKRGSDEWVKQSLGKVLRINPLGTVSSLVIFYLVPSTYFYFFLLLVYVYRVECSVSSFSQTQGKVESTLGEGDSSYSGHFSLPSPFLDLLLSLLNLYLVASLQPSLI